MGNDRFSGRVAAITGAGSGIGRALAIELARRGTHLALSDVDTTGLAETVAACEGRGVKVSSSQIDVADRDAVFAWADKVVEDHGRVNLVFNNAGVALGAPIESMAIADLEWLMGVNFWGVVHGTQAFLPHLKAAGDGHVINISSVFGLISIPTQSAYNAAKFGVRGFTDALRMELEVADCGVSCTTIHPGGVRTNIARRARVDPELADRAGPGGIGAEFDRIARTTPDKAAQQILKAVERNRRRALIGPDAKVIDVISRLPVGLYQRVLVQGARRRM
ncbi:MAG: SDR family NAD(P)-dependent oxidoreductase [Microthrixaceae bacterium]|jgi:NAD(P)-dependent dehydrogenase (short-subunit alcohol dehydrogenase family)|nr:SDR family NAD(P)-dependent oxidoreductase [Microthrixaceae bacterium]